MALVTNSFTTFTAVGNREDLTNIIYDISPTETPFTSSIGRVPVTATLHEWQTDSLAAASTANRQLQGDTSTAAAVTATTRPQNRTQISNKIFAITGTQEAVDKAGRNSEIAYQVEKQGRELKRDIEKIVTGNQAIAAGGSTTAPALRSLEAWYTSNTSRGTSGANGSTTAAQIVTGKQLRFSRYHA